MAFRSNITKNNIGILTIKVEHARTATTDDGFGLDQLFVRCCVEALSEGRYGLLVDFDDKGQPYIAMYDALSIINWKTGDVGGRKDSKLIVLQEKHLKEGQDKYGHDKVDRYRELELVDGLYEVNLLDDKGGDIQKFEPAMGVKRLRQATQCRFL